MSLKSLPTIQSVVDQHLCSGCGACSYAYPDSIKMIDTIGHGRRPAASQVGGMEGCVASNVCPSLHAESAKPSSRMTDNWGEVLEVWEGYAADDEIRFRGSSGGAVTALALYGLESKALAGVLHVKADKEAPLLNRTSLSKTRDQLLSGAGSRYSPASPCEKLSEIENASGPCMFIGKPCDVAGAVKASEGNGKLRENLRLTVAVFCAGTPAMSGTIALAKSLGVSDPQRITNVKFRGEGWPGLMTVEYRTEEGQQKEASIPYAQGWGEILQKHRQWRCNMCADHTGESADISVGDPWYRPVEQGDPGRSLIVVRSERGKRYVRAAIAAGILVAEQRDPQVIDQAQKHLLKAQASIWGRQVASRLFRVASPKNREIRRLRVWLRELSLREKVQSIYGAAKRIIRRQISEPERAVAYEHQKESDRLCA